VFHREILADFHINRLGVGFFALFPKHEIWCDLELLGDLRLKSEYRSLICGLVGLHSHGFDLSAGTIANVKRCRDLAFVARRHFFLLRLRSRATAGGVNRLKVYRRLAGILVLEMAHRLFVVRGGMQFECRLLPFQFGVRAQAHDHRQSESEDWCFHFLE
jgi:hypothetical protein